MDNLRDSAVLEGLVKKHVEDGKLYAAVCAAPAVVLGPWGLLKGLKVRLTSCVYSRFTMYFCAASDDDGCVCDYGFWAGNLSSFVHGKIGILYHFC